MGVFDRSTGDLKIAPLGGNRIVRMVPRSRNLQYGPKAKNAEPVKKLDAAEIKAANQRLVEEFGSQRRKRQLAAAKAGQVNAAMVSGGQSVLGLIANAGANVGSRDAVIKESLSKNRNIPPHHPEARTADEAYRLDEIIPSSLSDALEIKKLFPAENKADYRAELRKGKVFGDGYVLSRLPVLNTMDADAREGRARCLVFLGHLLKLITSANGNMIRIKPDESISGAADRLRMHSSVLEGILDVFYSRERSEFGDRYVLTKEKRNLMMGWVMVLAVRAEDQCVMEAPTLSAFATELKMRPADVATHFRELGCLTMRVNGTGGSYKVSLMPPSSDVNKTLGDYFPGLKLGAKKRK